MTYLQYSINPSSPIYSLNSIDSPLLYQSLYPSLPILLAYSFAYDWQNIDKRSGVLSIYDWHSSHAHLPQLILQQQARIRTHNPRP